VGNCDRPPHVLILFFSVVKAGVPALFFSLLQFSIELKVSQLLTGILKSVLFTIAKEMSEVEQSFFL
jgi:hypothetical protein